MSTSVTSRPRTRYGTLLRRPAVAAALATSVLGRLHESMISFGVIMLVTLQGSYAQAGVVMAAFGAGGMVAGPVSSRLADRYGHARVLLLTASAYALAVLGMAFTGDDVVRLAVVSALAGLFTPPLTPALRSTLPRLVTPDQRLTVYALESTLQELVFVAGPVLAGAVAVLAGPRAALVGAAAATLVGTVGYCLVVRRVPTGDEGHGADGEPGSPVERVGRLLASTVLRVLAGGVGFLLILSIAAVAVIAQVSGPSAQGSAGFYLGATSVGSIVGGLLFGMRVRSDSSLRARFAVLAGALAAAAAVAWSGAGNGASVVGSVVFGLVAFGYGTTIAPVGTVLFGRLGEEAGPRRSTEAFGWMGAAMGIGGMVGDASGGWLVTVVEPSVALLVAAAVAAATAAVVPTTERA